MKEWNAFEMKCDKWNNCIIYFIIIMIWNDSDLQYYDAEYPRDTYQIFIIKNRLHQQTYKDS